MPPAPPTIVLTAADPGTGTVTFSLAQDAGFPLATTTIYFLDTVSGAVLYSYPGETPVTAVLGPGISASVPYVVVAVTTDVSGDSPPSLPVSLTPAGWDGVSQTILVTDYIPDASSYDIYRIDTGVPTFIASSPVHVIADTSVYASEDAANLVQYEVRPMVDGVNAGQARIVRRTRTNARMCFVTGMISGLDANIDSDREIWFTVKSVGVKRTLQPRALQPLYQSRSVSREELRVHCNTNGVYGTYLLQEAVVEIAIPNTGLFAEFVVPTTATASIETLPLVARPLRPNLS